LIRDITVPAASRESRGKNEARRLRRQGEIPAVVYGGGKPTLAVRVNTRRIHQILHSPTGHNTIFRLEGFDGLGDSVMLVDWQFDPLRGELLHTDLKRIDLSQTLRVMAPLLSRGEAKGVKTEGGLLEIVNREVEVECLPANIPEHIVIDVSELGIGEAVRVRDLPAAEGYRVTSDPDKVLLHVILLKHEEEKKPEEAAVVEGAPVEAAASAEPEVIKKGKKEEEPEAKEPKAKEPKAKK